MTNLKETARKFWGNLEAIASALDYDPRDELMARVERLERAVANLGKKPTISETNAAAGHADDIGYPHVATITAPSLP